MLLPDGDGVELLTRTARAVPASAETAAVLLSTEAEVRDRMRGLRTGADEYVGKPYDAGYVVGPGAAAARRATAPRPATAPPCWSSTTA